jgi:hypothetical protein
MRRPVRQGTLLAAPAPPVTLPARLSVTPDGESARSAEAIRVRSGSAAARLIMSGSESSGACGRWRRAQSARACVESSGTDFSLCAPVGCVACSAKRPFLRGLRAAPHEPIYCNTASAAAATRGDDPRTPLAECQVFTAMPTAGLIDGEFAASGRPRVTRLCAVRPRSRRGRRRPWRRGQLGCDSKSQGVRVAR